LCRGKPTPPMPVTRQLLPKLAELITSEDKDVQQDALWALSYLTDGDQDRLSGFLEAGALPRVVQLLASPHMEVVTPALRTVGNIVTGDDLLTQAVLNEGALNSMLSLMSHHQRTVRKEACWLVSNVCAGTLGQIQMVFECNLFPALIHQLQQGEPDVQREACWALASATKGGNAQLILELVRLGVVPPLKHILELPAADARVQMVALEGLENILKREVPPGMPEAGDPKYYLNVMKQAGLPSAVLRLAYTANEELYFACERFLAACFPGDDHGSGDEEVSDSSSGAEEGGWDPEY
jgi:importin subunit alpha-1